MFSLPKPDQSSPTHSGVPSSPPDHQVSPPISPADLHYNQLDLDQLAEVMTLLTSAIKDRIHDSQSKHFAEQLLNITLDHLHKVMKGVVAKLRHVKLKGLSTEHFEAETDRVLTTLTDYIMELRAYITHMPPSKVQVAQGHSKDTRARGQSQSRVMKMGSQKQDPLFTEEQSKMIDTWRTLEEKVSNKSSFESRNGANSSLCFVDAPRLLFETSLSHKISCISDFLWT